MDLLTKLADLWHYTRWADRNQLEALSAAGGAPDAAWREFAHQTAAQEVWLARLTGRPPRVAVWPDLAPDEVRVLLDEVQAGLDAFLAQLTPEGLDRAISYTTSDGRAFTSLVGDILLHVCLHSQHHRGRINRHLRDAGYDPVPSDYIAFRRGGETAKAPR